MKNHVSSSVATASLEQRIENQVLKQFKIKLNTKQKNTPFYKLLNTISNFLPFLLNTISNKFNRRTVNKYVNKNYNNRFISDYPIAKLHFWPIHDFVDLAKKIDFFKPITNYSMQ